MYVPTSNKAAVVKASRSVRFREITRAISLFGSVSAIQPLKKNPSAKSHQYYEALLDNPGSSILVHNEAMQGINFISGEPNLVKKDNILKVEKNEHAANKDLSPWELTLLSAKEFGLKSKFNPPIVEFTSPRTRLSSDSSPLFLLSLSCKCG